MTAQAMKRAAAPLLLEPAPQGAAPALATEGILMCAPDHFGVDYVINPWMERQIGKAERELAELQWKYLAEQLSARARLRFIAPQAGAPDMVFTANAGLAFAGMVIVSRFRAPERRPEERWFREWFRKEGFKEAPWPEDIAFEGAGDALFDRAQPLIWCGHGWRTSKEAPALIENILGRSTVGLRLVDPRFYHLDTCFCPLPGGWLLYYPQAFDHDSQQKIATLAGEEKLIPVSEEDAMFFACNAVEARGAVFLNDATQALQRRLHEAGFTPVLTPLSEFFKAGGAAKCLTLKLDER
ncbi:dimethylarginine dimethylaminohydrolase family protein [Methylocystis heyeri]|nr:arginine deiminase-related protein [Methylocystis heyeri]